MMDLHWFRILEIRILPDLNIQHLLSFASLLLRRWMCQQGWWWILDITLVLSVQVVLCSTSELESHRGSYSRLLLLNWMTVLLQQTSPPGLWHFCSYLKSQIITHIKKLPPNTHIGLFSAETCYFICPCRINALILCGPTKDQCLCCGTRHTLFFFLWGW